MLVKARNSKNGEWGFLEKFEKYQYKDEGYVKALTSVSTDGKLTPVYVFKGEDFVSLSEIDEEVGIDRYIKAKKPLYVKSNEGFIVVLKAEVDFRNKVYFPERSSYEFYTLNGDLAKIDISNGVPFKKVLNAPDKLRKLVEEPLRLLGESFGDREVFLRSRL